MLSDIKLYVCVGGESLAPLVRHQPSFAKDTLKLWIWYRFLLVRYP